jgi:hypothetical protein
VELEIEPEPTPDERAAIERALAALGGAAREDPRGAWWRAGLEDALSADQRPARDTPNGHW